MIYCKYFRQYFLFLTDIFASRKIYKDAVVNYKESYLRVVLIKRICTNHLDNIFSAIKLDLTGRNNKKVYITAAVCREK